MTSIPEEEDEEEGEEEKTDGAATSLSQAIQETWVFRYSTTYIFNEYHR